jgi:zinc protease
MKRGLLPAAAAARPWTFPRAEPTTLSNGVRLWTCDLPGQPFVCVELALPCPLPAEPENLDGMTAVLARALRSAAPDGPGPLTGEIRASTDPFGIRLRTVCEPARARWAVGMLTARASQIALGDADLARLARSESRLREAEQAKVGERETHALHSALFGAGHRLGRPWAGSPATLRRVRPGDLRQFYQDRIGASSAVLVVAGDLAAIPAGADIAAQAGQWAGGAVRGPVPGELGGEPARRLCLVDQPEYEQLHVLLGYVGPGPATPGWPARQAAVYHLGGAQVALLDRSLREQHGYSFGFRAAARPLPGGAYVLIKGFVARQTAGPAIARLLDVVAEFRRTGCTAIERDAIISAMRGSAALQLQTARAVGNAYAETAIRGLEAGSPAALHAALEEVSADDIGDAAVDLLDPDRQVLVIAGKAADTSRAARQVAGRVR